MGLVIVHTIWFIWTMYLITRIEVLKGNFKFFKVWYIKYWKYRKYDDELCCCGEQMGHGGSICHHGGCRSMKEYTITCELEALNKL